MSRKVLVLSSNDNVAVALRALAEGEIVRLPEGRRVKVREAIPQGHKIALVFIPSGAAVLKYGQPIGVASRAIPWGSHVHVHNVESCRGRGDRSA